MVHILLVPGLLLALIGAHLALVVYHKYTQYPGPGRTESNVVGYPLFPVYMAKAGGFSVSYTHLRAHETRHDLVCRLLLEKKKQTIEYIGRVAVGDQDLFDHEIRYHDT